MLPLSPPVEGAGALLRDGGGNFLPVRTRAGVLDGAAAGAHGGEAHAVTPGVLLVEEEEEVVVEAPPGASTGAAAAAAAGGGGGGGAPACKAGG